MWGKTEQVRTSGKNLFDISSLKKYEINNNNLKASVVDGKIILEGKGVTTTEVIFFCLNKTDDLLKLNPGKYTLSFKSNMPMGTAHKSKTVEAFAIIKKADGSSDYSSTGNKGWTTFDIAEGDMMYFRFDINNGTMTAEFYDIQLEYGSSSTAYEPYTGGAPSPSPEYPQEIVNVGESGSINVEVGGGNLFKILQHSAGYYTGEPGSPVRKNTNTGYSWEAELLVLPGTELTLSVITSIMSRFRCYVIDDNGIILLKHEDSSANSVDYTHTFVVPDRGAKMYLSAMEVSAPEGTTIMLNSGKAALPYEPYRAPQTLTLATPNGLPGVPVSKDGNYTDADGQQWVCDEIDLERGKYVQRVVIENISGGWELKPSSDISGRFSQSRLTNTFQTAVKTAVCNIASFTSWGTPVNDKYAFALNTKVIYFSPPKGAEITAEELNAKLNSLSFPVVFVGELATPIERNLTPEEIAAYKALRTYGPTTVITNDAGAGMEVTYVADTKAYIDKKFKELNQAIVNTQIALL